MGKINDLDLSKWREYEDIMTDSLWIIEKRDTSGSHSAKYAGNFVPQIPNQLIRRFTKEGDFVLDPYVGSGTTAIEAKRLKRNFIGFDINKNALDLAQENCKNDNQSVHVIGKTNCILYLLDSTKEEAAIVTASKSLSLVIFHPPYSSIIKFSDNKDDLSNVENYEEFLQKIQDSVKHCTANLKKGGHIAFVIGDTYKKGKWTPIGIDCYNKINELNLFDLKSIVIKNFDQTAAKRNQQNLWRYRALAGNYFIFKHEYIFIFKKK